MPKQLLNPAQQRLMMEVLTESTNLSERLAELNHNIRSKDGEKAKALDAVIDWIEVSYISAVSLQGEHLLRILSPWIKADEYGYLKRK